MRLVALSLAGVLLVGGCGGDAGARDRSITEAGIGAAGQVLVVTGEGCAPDPLAVTVEQTAAAVVVTAEPVAFDDGVCQSTAQVQLDKPLLGRPVVDGATDQPVDTYQLPVIADR
jgi:hypothetical protein